MNKPDRYSYPVILTYFDEYIVATFPDLSVSAAVGLSESAALAAAKEKLGQHIYTAEVNACDLQAPTQLQKLSLEHNQRCSMIEVFMPAVRMAERNRAVSRTVTVPAWLNAMALDAGINFSQVLQEGLKKMLDIK